MNANATITNLERFKCPVCLQIPAKEVYQCRNGHVICDECSVKHDNCPGPQCVESIRREQRGRNVFMEETLDGLDLDCPFSDKGCVKRLKRDGLANHRSYCKFGKSIPLCEFLNFGVCDFEATAQNEKEVASHFATVHGQGPLIRYGNTMRQNLKGFFKSQNGSEKGIKYTRVILFPDFRQGTKILFVGRIKDDFVSWMFFDLNGNKDDENDETAATEIQVEIWSDETPAMSWKFPLLPILEADEHFSGSMVKISVPHLKRIRKETLDENCFVINIRLMEMGGS